MARDRLDLDGLRGAQRPVVLVLGARGEAQVNRGEAVVWFGSWVALMVIFTRVLVRHLRETDGGDWRSE